MAVSVARSEVPGDEQRHLARALELASLGRGGVSPNPMVGAVIVDADGRVLGEGHHARLGGLHAEAEALADAVRRGADVRGATMYVTLEPCAHDGRQPPCAEAIIEAGLGRVVIASDDPSGKAGGRGPGMLLDAGIAVDWAEGDAAAAARTLNQPFRKLSRTGLPLVVLKAAVTLDGRTATAAGDSKWISGEASRELVHRWRADFDAVAVGIGTAIADDPLLSARGVGAARQPTRVVFDSSARLPLDGRLVGTTTEAPVIVIAGAGAPAGRIDALTNAGVEVIVCPGEEAARLPVALGELGRRDISGLMLEGGATLAGAFHEAGELDGLRIFYAPVLLGGAGSRGLIGGTGPDLMRDAERPLAVDWEPVGDDMLARVRMREW